MFNRAFALLSPFLCLPFFLFSCFSYALVRLKSHLQEEAGRQKIKAMREDERNIPERVANVITFQFEDGNYRRARQDHPLHSEG